MNAAWYVAIPALVAAIGCGIGSATILRRANRHRVPVVGQVLERSTMRRPAWVQVTYPGPVAGQTLHARLTVGFAQARAGDPITVYVDPQNPSDVSLGPGGWSHVWALLLGLWGLMLLVFSIKAMTL